MVLIGLSPMGFLVPEAGRDLESDMALLCNTWVVQTG